MRYGWHIIILFILSFGAHAQDWQPLQPYPDCADLKIEYRVSNGQDRRYVIRKTEYGTGRKVEFDRPLASLQDLNDLQDFLIIEKQLYCPNSHLTPINIEQCLYSSSSVLNPQFQEMFQDVMAITATADLNCQSWEERELLRQSVEDLGQNERTIRDRSRSLGTRLLKLFLNEESDTLVEEYGRCGGRGNSDLFIQNMLLIEARNMCLFPKPEGAFSWQEMFDLTKKISEQYQGLSLIKLWKEKNKISYKAMEDIITEYASKSVKSTLPSLTDTEARKMVTDSANFKHLKKKLATTEKKFRYQDEKISFYDHNMAYVGVFSTDMPFELAEDMIPKLAEENIKGSLPSEWDEEKRKFYLEQTAIPLMLSKYRACIAPVKQDLATRTEPNQFGTEVNDENLIRSRAAKKKAYCDRYPAKCTDNCSSDPHYRSDADDKRGEMTAIQSCLYNSFSAVVPEVIVVGVDDAINSLESYLPNSDEIRRKLAKESQANFTKCLNSKVEAVTGKPFFKASGEPDNFNNELISINQFAQITKECTQKIQEEGALMVVNDVLWNMNELNTNDITETEKKKIIENTINNAFIPCQEKLRSLGSQDFAACTDIIEMSVAKEVVKDVIQDMKADVRGATTEYDNIQSTLDSCVASENQKFLDGMGTRQGHYLSSNESQFYSCIKKAIVDVIPPETASEYKEMIKQNQDQIKDKAYANGLSSQVQQVVKQCAEEKLNSMPDWATFRSQSSGISDFLKKDCSRKAEEFAAPKIMINEATIELKKLVEDELITQGGSSYQIGDILALTAVDMRNKYGIQLPANIPANDVIEYSIREAYKKFKEQNPTATMGKFTEYFAKRVEYRAVEKVRGNVFAKIDQLANGQGIDVARFKETVDVTCLNQIFKLLRPELAAANSGGGDSQNPLDQISELIYEGLKYSQKVSPSDYANTISTLKSTCDNIDNYTTLSSFMGTGAMDFVLKAQIHKETIPGLNKTVTDDYTKKLAAVDGDPNEARYNSFIDHKKAKLDALVKSVESPKDFNPLLFSDNELMNYARGNFGKLLKKNSAESKALAGKITTKIFSNRSAGSFADKFIKEQILEGIGLDGFVDARQQTSDEAGRFVNGWGLFRSDAISSLNRTWTPANLSTMLDWENIGSTQRKKIVDAVVDNVVVPTAQNRTPNNSAVETVVQDHVENYKYSRDDKTFSERVADAVSDGV